MFTRWLSGWIFADMVVGLSGQGQGDVVDGGECGGGGGGDGGFVEPQRRRKAALCAPVLGLAVAPNG